MGDYSMNTGVPCEPRTVDVRGFDNVDSEKISSITKPTVPYFKPAPLMDAVTPTSNTQRVEVGPTAGDITRRHRNG